MADVNGPVAGDPAPGFSAPRDGGESVSLQDFAGKKVVLYFYPKDDTPGCTKEGLEFSGLIDDFEAAETVILGVSRDPVKKHDKFRDKHGLKVILISDEVGTITEAYGVWVEKAMYGKKYMGIERATFLINRDGQIAQVWRKVKVPEHAATVLAAAKVLT
jgi:peroxiredoxin Q/BCP